MDEDWRNRLNKLPEWVRDPLKRLGYRYDYIAYRLASRVENFNIEVRPEVEKNLPGSSTNGQYLLAAHEQRCIFFLSAIRFADYFRPMSDTVIEQIPEALRPSGPSVVDDMKNQIRLRKQIDACAARLANLLRRHDAIAQRIGIASLNHDPLELRPPDATQMIDEEGPFYLDAIDADFERAVMRRNSSGRTPWKLASLMDRLHSIAMSNNALIPNEVWLGTSSRKSDQYFYDAFSGWLSRNGEEAGGQIPDGFEMSNQSWASLISCLTYKDVESDALQMHKSRTPSHIEKVMKNAQPRFGTDELFE